MTHDRLQPTVKLDRRAAPIASLDVSMRKDHTVALAGNRERKLDFLISARHVHSWSDSMHYAAQLAALMQASLTGLFVHESIAALPQDGPADMLEEAVHFLRELFDTALHAGPGFQRWAAALGVTQSQWRVGQGSHSRLMASIAPWHDLLILEAQPECAFESPGEIGELLLSLRQACLMLPPRVPAARLDTVVVASNGSPESVRAVRTSLPFLQHAKTVQVLQSRCPRTPPPLGLENLGEHLQRHGIAARTQVLDVAEAEAGRALLHECMHAGADLLVMGAYGHSRVSEWALGGATRHVLRNARLPVLLQH